MHVSKHHYAVELAQQGNTVFFLNPPNISKGVQVRIVEHEDIPHLFIVDYNLFFPSILRFHARKLYDFLLTFCIKKILKTIALPIDILWCFEPNLFSNFKHFKAQFTIYHLVDLVHSHQIAVAQTADLVLCVAQQYLDAFVHTGKPTLLVNHGLSAVFAELAQKNIPQIDTFQDTKRLKIGFIGNFASGALCFELFEKLVRRYANIDFYFWGSYEVKDNNLGGSENNQALTDIVNFLKTAPNAYLKGITATNDLAAAMQTIDAFILPYLYASRDYQPTNSHKILEYLSTGKTIVSTFIDRYKDEKDLLLMTTQNATEDDFMLLFDQMLQDINIHNAPEAQQKRINFALENTYLKQIEKIENYISFSLKK